MGKLGLCVVPDCLNVYYPGCRTKFHYFPLEKKKKERWLKRLNLTQDDLHVGARICYLHFKITDYCNHNPEILKPYALPSVNEDRRYSDESDVESSNLNKISIDDIDKILDDIGRTSPPVDVDEENDTNDDASIGELSIDSISSDDGRDEEPNENKVEPKKRRISVKRKPITNISKRVLILYPEQKDHNFVEELDPPIGDDDDMMDTCESENEIMDRDDVNNVLTQVCRTCLATGCKMYSIKQYDLEQAYIQLTGLCADRFEEIKKMPRVLCFECIQRLQNYVDFSTKSITSSLWLMGFIEENKLTIENVKSIDREQNLLASTLTSTHFGSNHLNVEIHADEDINKKNEGRIIDTTNNQDNNATDETMVVDLDNDDRREQEEESDQWEEEKDQWEKEQEKEEKKGEENDENNLPPRRRVFEHVYNTEISAVSDDNEYCARGKKSTRKLSWKEMKKIFAVKTMTLKEKREEIENRKNRYEYLKAKLRCDKCFRGFQSNEPFTEHMKRHTSEAGEFICDICHVYFKTSGAVYSHKRRNHTKLFSCRMCSFITTFRESAQAHKNYHEGFRFQCKMCPKHYSKLSVYLDHKRLAHPEDCVCHLCGSSFVLTRDLDRHIQLAHREENLHLLPATDVCPYGQVRRLETPVFIAVSYVTTLPEDAPHCSTCDIRFRNEEALSAHLSQSTSHGNIPIYKPRKRNPNLIRSCYKKNKTSQAYSKVKRADVPVTCEQCGEDCINYQSYGGHFALTHPYETRTQYPENNCRGVHMCEICGKIYQRKYSLDNHRQTHNGETYPCDKCKKTFLTKGALYSHKKQHTHARQCSLCGKKLSSMSSMLTHMRIHTHKPYSCKICEKRYCTPSDRKKHMRHAHMGVPRPRRWPKDAPKDAPKTEFIKLT